jgi:hemerythrin
MAFDWKPEFAVGVPAIDDQHQEIFRRAAHLFEVCAEGKGQDEVAEVLTFLQAYVGEHFTAEEKLQRESGFPGADAHRAQHEAMKKGLTELTDYLARHGPGLELVVLTNRLVVDWLTRHIMTSDMAVAEHVRGLPPAS